MARCLLITGASVALYVNGIRYAKVTGITFNIDTPQKEIRGCDSAQPFELAATSTTVAGTMTIYRQEQDGGAEGAGLTVPIVQIAKAKYVSIVLVDMKSGTTLFEADRCAISSQGWTFATHSYAMGNVSFSAIDYLNEFRPGQ